MLERYLLRGMDESTPSFFRRRYFAASAPLSDIPITSASSFVDILSLRYAQILRSFEVRSGCFSLNVLKNVEDIGFCYLTNKDVVRHPLVQQIVTAYDEFEKKQARKEARRKEQGGRNAK